MITKMKYHKGSIIRITLQSFLTFDQMELKPKNKFTLICGANGAGKSTFICAIVLGLGGKPSIIGRSPNLSDYVKHGEKKAVIELELYNPDGNNFVITRHITSNSKSTWFLQRKEVPFKKVEELVEGLNIQINNLCQILPQDRVQDFAKMNPKELLDATQKSIGDSEMYEWFHRLRNFRMTIIDREKNLLEKVKKYEAELQKNKRMEADVKSYQEKQDILNKVSLIKKRMQWLIYEEKNDVKRQMQDDYQKALSFYNEKKRDFEPLRKLIQEAEKQQTLISQKIKDEKSKNTIFNNSLNNFVRKHLNLKDKIDSITEGLKAKLEAEALKEKQIAEMEQSIKNMEDFLPTMDESGLVANMKETDLEIDKIIKQISHVRSNENEVRDKAMTINQGIRALEHKVQQLNSVREKKLEILSRYEDVKKAYDWLELNRDKFQGRIYGPMFLELNVQNPNCARYIEHIISWRDLVAFVCEDPRDMSNLLRILRDGKKLKINAVTSTPLECSLDQMFKPSIHISHLRHLGFQSYLLDAINGPDVILKFMCTTFGIHGIPFGSDKIEENLESIPKEVKSFFSENTFYNVSYSVYSGEKVQNVTHVGRSQFLSTSVNQELLQSCTEELNRKQQEFQGVQHRLSEMAEMKNKFEVELNALRNKKREFSRSLEQLKATIVRLRIKKDDLAQFRKNTLDPNTEKAKAKVEIESCIEELIKNEIDSGKALSNFVESNLKLELLALEHGSAEALVMSRNQDAREFEDSLIAAREEAERLKSQLNQLQIELKTLHNKAKELCEGWDSTDERFKKKYLPLFAKLPQNRTRLEELLHETDAMAKCFQGSSDAQILQEYEKSCKLLRDLEKEVDRLKAAASGIQEEAMDLLSSWLPKMGDLIDKINDKFGAFFAAMRCSGVVELDKGPDPTLYENYGLIIKVKFRDEGELQVLDPHTQSGGERALTTAVYLLSLQAITKVPFRCVDEINQGMDEINEKRVYSLIMDTVSACDTAQYFLVTPTLFPDVEYPEGTDVHCIHYTTNQDSFGLNWNLKGYLESIGVN